MCIKVLSRDIKMKDFSEPIFEISYNDFYYFYIRKSLYEKFNKGEISLSISNNIVKFKNNNDIKKIKNVFWGD